MCLRGARKGKREEKRTGIVRVLTSKVSPGLQWQELSITQGGVHGPGGSRGIKTVVSEAR